MARYRELELTGWFPEVQPGQDAWEWSESPAVLAGQVRLDEYLSAHAAEWICRRCQWWRSRDGHTGECLGPEISCGTTNGGAYCEQFDPVHSVIE